MQSTSQLILFIDYYKNKTIVPSSTEAKVFDYVEDLYRLLYGAVIGFLGYDEIDVDVRVDEIPVGGAPYCTLDAH